MEIVHWKYQQKISTIQEYFALWSYFTMKIVLNLRKINRFLPFFVVIARHRDRIAESL